MLDFRKAQTITRKIDFDYQYPVKKIKWTEIYKSKTEILEDLKEIHIPSNGEMLYISRLYKGYEYIHSFARQIQSGKSLTEKQLTQCKRLALEIKKAYEIKDCFEL